MAEITRHRQGQLVQGVLKVLAEHPEGLQARRVIADLEQRVPPTSFEDSEYPKQPGVRRYGKIVRFSTIAPVKAGWMTKEKGIWQISEEGREALTRFPDPAQLYGEAARLYQEWEQAQPEEGGSQDIETVLDTEETAAPAATTLEEAEEAAWEEVRRYLAQINPYDFQDLVAELLEAMGYHVAWRSPKGPDRGLDILAYNDPLGATGPRIKVQVKRRADRIDPEGVRAFLALLGSQDIGLFVSLGGFTEQAEEEARTQENRRLNLFDAAKLFDLWVAHYAALSEAGRRMLPLRPVHYLAPDE